MISSSRINQGSKGVAPALSATQYIGRSGLIRRQCVSKLHLKSRSTLSSRLSPLCSALPPLEPLDGDYEANHVFTDYASWVIPGHVMQGRYPFIEPSRCSTRDTGEYQLNQILEAGISTFVCLQDEIPPQEKMTLGGKNGFLPYKSTAELIKAALNGPPPMELVEGKGLRNPTLNKFLPPTKHNLKQQTQYEKQDTKIKFLYSPIVDLGVPSSEALSKLLLDLRQRLEDGEKLYIHCWGGRGRSGTVCACLLSSAYGISVEEALERVQRSYLTRQDEQDKSPETEEQLKFVRDFISSKR